MYSLGIDIGYSAIKIVLINGNDEVKYMQYLPHKGRVKQTLIDAVKDLSVKYNLADIKFGAVTGSGSKILIDVKGIEHVNDIAAIIEGSKKINNNIGSIIEIGGQSAKYITLPNVEHKEKLEISMNTNCSAGTGSFLAEQMSRLNLKVEDYSAYAGRAKSIPRIAGRCSVFAKTDITHHQQEGVVVEDILLGFAYAVVRSYKGAVIKNLPVIKPILFIGGVAHNQGVVTALKDILNLAEGELIIPEHFSNVEAVGAALMAKNDKIKIELNNIENYLEHVKDYLGIDVGKVELPNLISFGEKDSLDKHICKSIKKSNDRIACYLGVDIGSTSTNLVLMNDSNEIFSFRYLKTLGNPMAAVRKGLEELKEEFGDAINVIGVGTTGSGRYMIGEFIGADVIKDEITAQAKAAATIDSSVDTIFEIGGQDSKFISIENSVVKDFQMNKICAAGTGSFIEEQAKKFNIPINDFGNIALSSNKPIDLGERCTVFIETSIAANLSQGADLTDIAAGLCYSIVKNYLNRVVGQKKIGNRIFFQGGVAHNQGVINAFRAIVGDKLYIPPFFSVTGAYGVALLVKEEMGSEKTKFKGFCFDESYIESKEQYFEKNKELKDNIVNRPQFINRIADLIFEGYDGVIDTNKKTVGMPRALFSYGMYAMFNAFFRELGFNVILSDASDEETVRLCQEYSLDETCFPVKLINGHVAHLIAQKVDYVFFPNLYSVEHHGSNSRQDFGCAYMQLAFKMIDHAMDLEKKGITLLAPTIAFSFGSEFMMKSFASLGEKLDRTPEQIANALRKGKEAFEDLKNRYKEYAKEKAVTKYKPNEKAFVLLSKIYGVADPVLNMGIPKKLMDMGCQVIPFFTLPEFEVAQEYPNMYWPFGQHILGTAKFVKQHPNLYAVVLTHHGCGPDTVLSHYIAEIMDGKPYLNIEVDEHSSEVGVMTRVEAFVNSLNKLDIEAINDSENYLVQATPKKVNIKKNMSEMKDGTVFYLPYMYPYSEIFREILSAKGIKSRVLPRTTGTSLDLGRKHTITNEYFSLVAILGDVLKEVNQLKRNEAGIAFLIPQTEGTEADGQYNRFVRAKLDAEGFQRIEIVAPFIEDLLEKDDESRRLLYLGLLAGDVIRIANKNYRGKYLSKVLDLIDSHCFDIYSLKAIATEVYKDLKLVKTKKTVLAIGEIMILYNEALNNFTFNKLEEEGHRIIYAPFSEYMWFIWKDFIEQNRKEKTPVLRQRLDEFKQYISDIARCLVEESPYEKDLDGLRIKADSTIGYYAGANGRYREAKLVGELQGISGIITVTSMYENTGIVLNVVHKGVEKGSQKPILNLTFDGNKNENDEIKLQSFMYYL